MGKLTIRQRFFVEFYLQTFKAGESARRAGYRNYRVDGTRLMQNPKIKVLIDERMREESAAASEVLARLSQQARANIADFLIFDSDDISINWDAVKEKGYLIKRIFWSSHGLPGIELYDAQEALLLLAKLRRMFVTQVEKKSVDVNIYLPETGCNG